MNRMTEISNTAYNSIGRSTIDSTDVWHTPTYVVDFAINRWGKFDLDAAASKQNTICKNFISQEMDALSTEWSGNNVWLNPPYGRSMPKFIRRAKEQVDAGNVNRVVCLIACRTDTKIFQEVIFPYASEIFFIKGRISFSGQGPANFASCYVVFDNSEEQKINYGVIR